MRTNNYPIKVILLLAVLLCFDFIYGQDTIRVGLAWKPSLTIDDRAVLAIEKAGGEAVVLGQVRHPDIDYDSIAVQSKFVDEYGVLLPEYGEIVKNTTWHGSNVEEVMQGIDAVVFLGGGDISSTLFREPQPWHRLPDDNNCNAARDISEYLTMTYCLDHDIPILGLCRGMQMLGVVSGATMIQDLDTYFAGQGVDYEHLHRSLRDENGERHYTPHDVVVTDFKSHFYSIVVADTLKKVPSWHHQVVGDVTGTPLKVTGITPTNGKDIIEVIERTDKTFAMGVQFHPEEAVRKHLSGEDDANQFMQLYEGVNYFRKLINHTKKFKNKRQ